MSHSNFRESLSYNIQLKIIFNITYFAPSFDITLYILSQQTFTSSKSTVDRLEKG